MTYKVYTWVMNVFYKTFRRELYLRIRQPAQWLNPLVFLLMAVMLFPLAVDPSPGLLTKIAAGVIWVCALFSTLFSLDTLFSEDVEDGTLDQYVLSGHSLWVFSMAKTLMHWCLSGLLLIGLMPLLSLWLFLPGDALWALILTLLLGTPSLSLVGALGAALMAGMKRGGALLSVIILPFYTPVLIFSASAVYNATLSVSYMAQIGYLAGLLCLFLTFIPFAVAAALKMHVIA